MATLCASLVATNFDVLRRLEVPNILLGCQWNNHRKLACDLALNHS